MESIQKEINPRYKKYSSSKDPYYYAHYLNLARLNTYLIIEHLSAMFGFESEISEENLAQSKIIKLIHSPDKPQESRRLIGILVKYFPFLRPWREEPRKIQERLKVFIEVLHLLRNNYSHFKRSDWSNSLNENDQVTTQKSITYLEQIFREAIDAVTKKFEYNTNDIEHLLLPENDDKIYHYAFKESTKNALSQNGLVYFVCLFLEKSYAVKFLKRIHGFKGGHEKKFQATINAFTHFCCRLPYPKLNSEDYTSSLLMDMVGELKRCPETLYFRLNEIDKKRFVTGLNLQQQDVTEAVNTDDQYESETVMRRYEDRFTYFVLRYLDECEVFNKLRFHVNLGKYAKTNEHGTFIKPLNGFAKLSDAINKIGLNENYFVVGEEDKLVEEIEHFSPSYQISDHKIGFKFISNRLYAKIDPFLGHVPDGILSVSELPHLLFLEILKRDGLSALGAEDVLKQCIAKYKKFFVAIKTGTIQQNADKVKLQSELDQYGILLKDIPEKIKNFLLAKERISYKRVYQGKLKNLIGDVEKRLKDCEYEIKRRKNNEKRLKDGEIATYLASDIVLLTPSPKGKSVFDADYYRELQASLAYFKSSKRNLLRIIKELKLKSPEGHPFIKRININKCNGLLDFYEDYLKLKKNYTDKLSALIERTNIKAEFIEENYLKYFHVFKVDFIRFDGEKYKVKTYDDAEIKQLANNLMSLPHYIPRGVFADQIRASLKKKGFEIENCSITYLMNKYLASGIQSFYAFKRSYSIKGKTFFEDLTAEKYAEYWGLYKEKRSLISEDSLEDIKLDIGIDDEGNKCAVELKDYKKYVVSKEQKINQEMLHDKLTYEMIKDLSTKVFSENASEIKWSLSDISIGEDKPSNVMKEFFSYRVFVPVSKVYVEDKNMTYRRFGSFRKLIKDRRLQYLFKYFPAGTVLPRKYIERELDVYESKREEIFEKVYQFEKALLQSDSRYQATPEEGHFNHKDLLIDMQNEEYTNIDSVKTIFNYRNRFYHNQYIEPDKLTADLREKIDCVLEEIVSYIDSRNDESEQLKASEIPTIAFVFWEYVSKFYDNLIEKVNKTYGK